MGNRYPGLKKRIGQTRNRATGKRDRESGYPSNPIYRRFGKFRAIGRSRVNFPRGKGKAGEELGLHGQRRCRVNQTWECIGKFGQRESAISPNAANLAALGNSYTAHTRETGKNRHPHTRKLTGGRPIRRRPPSSSDSNRDDSGICGTVSRTWRRRTSQTSCFVAKKKAYLPQKPGRYNARPPKRPTDMSRRNGRKLISTN